MGKIFICALWMTGFLAFSAQAEQGACKADREKFCAAVKSGGGAVARCLKAHEAELSSECRAHGAEMKAKMRETREACKGDREKFCPGLKAGGGAIVKCLKQHEADLSQTCKDSFPRKKK